eukprot:m.217108 g.217108  ORF g.217108 m.217108 type:complete len:374 (-) comp10785_c1_seq17:1421-2542(-)
MRSVELATVFASLLAARLAAALWSPISDCDETFNYWEPLHYRVHGSGFQTWEYSPAYAIRSYAYVEAHALIVRLAAVLGFDERSQFYVLRAVLALICALSETMLVDAVSRATILAGPAVARWTWLFLLASTGMFVASTGFLPSTTALYTFMLATAAWLRRRDLLAIFFVALGALFAWPFSGALGVPIAVDLIFRRGKLVSFVRGAVLAAVIILVPLVLFDSWMYGKLVVAPLNIVLYNVLSSNTSSELYGTEPWWFYFANGALNFNIAFAMALVSPILVCLHTIWPAQVLSWDACISSLGTRLWPLHALVADPSDQPTLHLAWYLRVTRSQGGTVCNLSLYDCDGLYLSLWQISLPRLRPCCACRWNLCEPCG